MKQKKVESQTRGSAEDVTPKAEEAVSGASAGDDDDKSLLLSLLTDICLELAYSSAAENKQVADKEVFNAAVYSELRRAMEALDLGRVNIADIQPETLVSLDAGVITPRVQDMVINLAKKLMEVKCKEIKKLVKPVNAVEFGQPEASTTAVATVTDPAKAPTYTLEAKSANKALSDMENAFKEICEVSEWNKDLDRRIRETIVESTRLYWHFLSVELKSLEILLELVEDLILNTDAKNVQVKAEYLLKKSEALFLKLKSFHYTVLCDTYNRKSTEALQVINSDLSDSVVRIKQELEARRTALNQLQGVGAEFQVLVSEYKVIREEITQTQWSLNKLQALRLHDAAT